MELSYLDLIQDIENAVAVILDYDALVYPYVDQEEGFVQLTVNDVDYLLYDNDIVSIVYRSSDAAYTVTMNNKDTYVIQLLELKKLDNVI